MLADKTDKVQLGYLDAGVHLPATSKLELMGFIAHELPFWRDHRDRPAVIAEATLTEQLCDHLSSAASRSTAWSHVQFRTETVNQTRGDRKIDLTVKPLGCTIYINGRRHTIFDALFPIECKRLPTPSRGGRDEREYVFTDPGTTGGIQRFKFGYHGASHNFGAMIGYVQDETFEFWLEKVNEWIKDLANSLGPPWSEKDCLKEQFVDSTKRSCSMNSIHERTGGLKNISLRHVWIGLN